MKALILDMDGVLVDTEPLIFMAFREIFSPLHISLADEYLYKLVGDPTRKNIQDISRDFAVDLDVDLFTQKLDEQYLALLDTASISLVSGVVGLLEKARSCGMKTALCTTSESWIVERIMRRIDEAKILTISLKSYFHVLVSGDLVTSKKPDPEPYFLACKLLQTPPQDALVVEDSAAGIASAKAAGCFCVGLRAPYNRDRDFNHADLVIDRLIDLRWPYSSLCKQSMGRPARQTQ